MYKNNKQDPFEHTENESLCRSIYNSIMWCCFQRESKNLNQLSINFKNLKSEKIDPNSLDHKTFKDHNMIIINGCRGSRVYVGVKKLISGAYAILSIGSNVPTIIILTKESVSQLGEYTTKNKNWLKFFDGLGWGTGGIGTVAIVPFTVINSFGWMNNLLNFNKQSLYTMMLSFVGVFSGVFNGVNTLGTWTSLVGDETNWKYLGLALGTLCGFSNSTAILNEGKKFSESFYYFKKIFNSIKERCYGKKEITSMDKKELIAKILEHFDDFIRTAELQFSDKKINGFLKSAASGDLQNSINSMKQLKEKPSKIRWVLANILGPILAAAMAGIGDLNTFGTTKNGLTKELGEAGWASFLSLFSAIVSTGFQFFLWMFLIQSTIVKPSIRFFTPNNNHVSKICKNFLLSLPATCLAILNIIITCQDEDLNFEEKVISAFGSVFGNFILSLSGLSASVDGLFKVKDPVAELKKYREIFKQQLLKEGEEGIEKLQEILQTIIAKKVVNEIGEPGASYEKTSLVHI